MGKLVNRARMTVSGTPGTGAVSLGAAVAGHQSFAAAGVNNNDVVSYVIEDGSAWEIGQGTYSSTGPSLARTTVQMSSNSNLAINASANAIIYIAAIADDLTSGTAAGNLLRLDGNAKIPAVDGSQLTSLVPGQLTEPINTQTASYTLVLGDVGKLIEMSVASANNLTVPPNASVAWPVGKACDVVQAGAGQTTILAGSGVTLLYAASATTLRVQNSMVTLFKKATDTWYVSGDMTP